MDSSAVDCLVTVSGDGLLWEVVNGLMQRPDWKVALKVPLAIIPAGKSRDLEIYLRLTQINSFRNWKCTCCKSWNIQRCLLSCTQCN